MNQQPNAGNRPQARRPVAGEQPPVTSVKKRGADPKLLHILYRLMLAVGGAILLVGLLLIILPAFRIKEIRVEGNSYYTAEQIIAASELEVGQEILALDTKGGIDSIYHKCKYVKSARILRTPFSVRIEIVEFDHVMYTEFNGKYYSLNRDFRVLEESEDAATFADFLFVKLPDVSALAVGAKLRFADQNADLSYINEMIDRLEENGTLASVTSLDVSEKNDVSYVMGNTCRVTFGKPGESHTKLLLVEEILARKGGVGETPAVIDVSNPQKPTYRPLADPALLMAG